MRAEIPIFRQISLDAERTPRELHVFWAAVELLDLVDERPMTLTALETTLYRLFASAGSTVETRPSRSTISVALNQLEEAGYLCRREDRDGRAMWRVPLSRCPRDAASVSPAKSSRSGTRKTPSGVVSELF